MSCIEIKQVSKAYKKTIALDGINLKIHSRTIVGLIGPNGSGKTTLLRLLSNLTKPTEGNIKCEGHVEGIIENPALYSKLSGKKNLILKASLCKNIDKKRIDDVVKLLGLENRINDKVRTYSLGMKQRLAIAMAILSKPEILVLDEPMNGLDPTGMKELGEIILKLRDTEQITIIVSSHLLNKLEEISNELVFIRNGKIVNHCEVNEALDAETLYFDLMEGNKIE